MNSRMIVCALGIAAAMTGCKSAPDEQHAQAAPVETTTPESRPAAEPAPAPAPGPVAATPSKPFAIEPITSVFDEPAIRIDLEYADAPDLKDWAEKSKSICEEWYPKICEILKSEGFTPPTHATMVFDPNMHGVAATSRMRIRASATYVRQHQDDYGMMVHELVHVVQSYPNRPKRAPGWLVEGIADYIRFYKYEPGADHSRINPDKASYRDAYRTTARFLDWVVETKDADIIRKLNASLRKGECDEEKAKEIFGGDIDGLWKQFIDERVRRSQG